ncbi:S8 family peptidase [Chryseobacterium sp. LC2016-27]|uniref:S8 family peptidase n=1 Tax=Chryseobacterium sp. LC2016-27 TaxID=2897326 RepID=UPI001E45C87E|nr:S8 family peptidase [Chryseobacterium sp. LC2016-27]MCD0456504.1 S8 family peptidase [Chryseobacterium sp. LC2016-27]
MKKHLLLISTLAISLLSAQSNEALKREFEKQNKENNAKFDSYVAKRYGANRSPEVLKEIEEQRGTLSGFDPSGKPYFLSTDDIRQSQNSNADFLQDGTISGLTGSFNGENIKFTVFDGGRVLSTHNAFNNLPNRITNKEASTVGISAHATGVSGFIGSKDVNFTGNFVYQDGTVAASFTNLNLRGVAKNSLIDSYTFSNTVLPGNTAQSTVFQKILAAQPKISNHSYGTNLGWSVSTVSGAAALVWNGAYTSPNQSADLQGTYYSSDQKYDQIVYANPSYIIVKSSGNYFGTGPDMPGATDAPKYYSDANGDLVAFAATDTLPSTNCSLGYDCVNNGSLAKNIIVVGANNVITTNNGRYVLSSDVIHSDYSSAGPRDDGGIKPDISAVGTDVVTASSGQNTSIQYGSGTSYSAPIVTGIFGLWTQINKQLFNNAELNAASAKTLMIHSALEAGNIGPDPHFGWGLIDAKKGAELLVGKSNNSVIFTDETLTSGVANIKTVKASGNEPLKVTISWIDPEYVVPANLTWAQAYNNRSSRLVNDLDVRIIDTTTNTAYQPWKLDANSPMTPATKADNTVDNVEQVVLDNPVAGRTYRIEITNKGTLVNNAATPVLAPQDYSIIVTGFSEVLGTKDVANSTNGIIIAPTLTKDVVNILKAPKRSSYTVYDLSGKKLQNGVINSAQEAVSLSSYTNGIYIIEVKTDKDVISKKVIKE